MSRRETHAASNELGSVTEAELELDWPSDTRTQRAAKRSWLSTEPTPGELE